MKTFKCQKSGSPGYTLLEMLVTIGAIAVVGSLIAQVFFATTRTNTKSELLKDVKQNGDYAVEIMSRMIRNSYGIVSTCSDAGTTLSTLEIKNPDGEDTQFGCIYDSSVSRIASTSATTGSSAYLTSVNVSTGGSTSCSDGNTLQFVCYSHPDEPSSVSIQFTLSQKGTPVDQFEKAGIQFKTTVAPRN